LGEFDQNAAQKTCAKKKVEVKRGDMKKMEEIGKEAETKLKGKFLVKVFTEGKKVVRR